MAKNFGSDSAPAKSKLSDNSRDNSSPTWSPPKSHHRPQSTIGWSLPQACVSPQVGRPSTAVGWEDKSKDFTVRRHSTGTRECCAVDPHYYTRVDECAARIREDTDCAMGGKLSSEPGSKETSVSSPSPSFPQLSW